MARESNAIELLKQDHREVESMFKQLEAEDESRGKIEIAQHICLSLIVHSTIEEEIFYPAARQALDEEDREMVAEANVEHASLKQLIADIGGSGAQDEMLDARLTVLKEYVQHHVREEEQELMPAVKKTDLDLDTLGGKLMQRKQALMEQYRQYAGGNGATVKLPPAAKRASKGTSSKRSSAKRATAKRASSRGGKKSGASRRSAQR
ncbi:MAG TPA: hemerythrin domain-containing protein [Rhodanobacteraceae bacterium]|nr:hemerythrin domain-containing protein [Rhodanobacteraceae bacterium]